MAKAATIEDTVISGPFKAHVQCNVCGTSTLCVAVEELNLPEGIEPSHKLIPFRKNVDGGEAYPMDHLGIGCGCYARFHRQLGHITSALKRRH